MEFFDADGLRYRGTVMDIRYDATTGPVCYVAVLGYPFTFPALGITEPQLAALNRAVPRPASTPEE